MEQLITITTIWWVGFIIGTFIMKGIFFLCGYDYIIIRKREK